MTDADQANNVPLSVQGTLTYPDAVVAISTYGQPFYGLWQQPAGQNGYWFMVIDLTSLKQLVSVFSADQNNVPSQVAPYIGQINKLLIFTSVTMGGYQIPQAKLFSTLKAVGAGPLLDRCEQVATQLGTGTFSTLSYILVATMDESGLTGFEQFSLYGPAVETLSLMPTVIDGQTVYTPVPLG
jgi:hypothetical protein